MGTNPTFFLEVFRRIFFFFKHRLVYGV